MKFHCESCNARYSIPDERVRGKVLKIRCKSCSAVITVREDADPDALESEADRPSATDVEWYMSIDGAQTGPMKLPAARTWLAKQSRDVDVYCWYDGFGDWKKTSEVALFANVGRPAPAAPPPAAAKSVPEPAPTIVPTLRSSLVAPSPAPAHPAKSPATRPSPSGPVPTPGPRPAQVPAQASRQNVPARQRPSTTGPTGPMTSTPSRRVPLMAPPSIPPTPLPDPRVGAPSPGLPTPGARTSPTGPTPGPLEPPAVVRADPDAIPPPGADMPERPLGSPRSAASSPTDLAKNDPFAGHDDLELDIEEPSRVVNLEVLKSHRHGGLARSSSLPGMDQPNANILAPPETRSESPDIGLANLAEDSGTVAVPPRRRSYMTVILTAIIVLSLGAAALAFVVLRDSKDDADNSVAGGGVSDDFENLGFQIDRPDRRVGSDGDGDTDRNPRDKARTDKNPTPRTERKSSSSSRRRSDRDDKSRDRDDDDDDTSSSSRNGTTTTDDTSTEPLRPLSPDDVIRQSGRSQISFKRCYERAKKKDPFLEVRSLSIHVKIDPSGAVKDVKLDKMQGTYLGKCLEATVKRWKLPASTEGINTEISLEFER